MLKKELEEKLAFAEREIEILQKDLMASAEELLATRQKLSDTERMICVRVMNAIKRLVLKLLRKATD